MLLALDIDGVIANPFEEINHQLSQRGFETKHWDSWTSETWHGNYPNIPMSVFDEIFTSNIFALNVKPFEDSWYWINHMSSTHEIVYITARNPKIENATYRWFYEWDIPVDRIYFAKHKVGILKKLNDVALFVEDYPPMAEHAHNAGFNSYLIQRPYNRYTDSKIQKINSLWEIDV